MKATTMIAAPVAAVWKVLLDVERWPDWTPTVTSARWLDPGGMRPGARVRLTQPKLGTAVWTVTDVQPGRSFVWIRRSPGVATLGDHVLTDGPGGTSVTLGIEHSGPLAGLARLLTDRLTRRYVETEAHSLKAHCEA
ncbi:MAG TPA: SRPBCC family protein [Micromonosporaceae bacterium]